MQLSIRDDICRAISGVGLINMSDQLKYKRHYVYIYLVNTSSTCQSTLNTGDSRPRCNLHSQISLSARGLGIDLINMSDQLTLAKKRLTCIWYRQKLLYLHFSLFLYQSKQKSHLLFNIWRQSQYMYIQHRSRQI